MDLWGPLNRIFVRADVAPLFLDWKLALVPTVEVLQKLLETVEHNFLMPTDQRRSCFEVLPPGEYEYDLIPVEKDPPTLFLIRNGSTSPQKLDLAYPQYPHVKLNVHPAFAVVHGIYQQYPSVHGGHLYFRLMSLITAVCYSSIPREFRDARPSIQLLPRRSSGQEDDKISLESDDSERILQDDCDSDSEAVGIRSWLEAVPRSNSSESHENLSMEGV
ncbi:hypothetical protein F5878DRAFT_697528 [Lentinula raphanica]|uniref:Uncharacterized protein n=1 Tax=Lentinula raphanica TaxID=153919 RepID=A0AA38P0G2_9AGAR|nr:hypothetical protein F5878DRAFT_697528 [Lentinula raphanica]